MSPMSSWEEDWLFEQYGWTKNLIQRRYEGPRGHAISFDEVVSATATPEGEETLRQAVMQFGSVPLDSGQREA